MYKNRINNMSIFCIFQDHKTATYIAVEKGYVSILKLLLNANPDLEIATKVCNDLFNSI